MYVSTCVLVQVLGVFILASSSSCSDLESIKIEPARRKYAENPSEPHTNYTELSSFENKRANQEGVGFKRSKECVCGRVSENVRTRISRQSSKIIGGYRINEKHHPFLALLNLYGIFQCGGSIINRNYVLTAAHCVEKVLSPSDLQVVLGVHSRSKQKHRQTYKVISSLIHPDYIGTDLEMLDNDIALLRLDRPIKINEYVRPICLPEIDTSIYTTAYVQGWGDTKDPTVSTDTPLETKVHVVSHEVCSKTIEGYDNPNNHICAGADYTGTCHGDSGGPLYVKTPNNDRILIGVVSRGKDCFKESGTPDTYMKVEAYLDWIAKNTKDAEYCSYPKNI